MKLALLSVGKTRVSFVAEGVDFYSARIRNYNAWELLETTDVKHVADTVRMVAEESEKVLKLLKTDDYVILLDEKGTHHSSVSFAGALKKCMDKSPARIVFVIAGAWGAGEPLRKRANEIWSLSKLTFPHQLVRLILAEQIYRAMTILRNQPYHHEG